jgi:hypothetical protein
MLQRLVNEWTERTHRNLCIDLDVTVTSDYANDAGRFMIDTSREYMTKSESSPTSNHVNDSRMVIWRDVVWTADVIDRTMAWKNFKNGE